MYYSHKLPATSPYPYGMSGMGQVIPGIQQDTQKLVIYGSLALIGFSAAIWFLNRRKGAQRGGSV